MNNNGLEINEVLISRLNKDIAKVVAPQNGHFNPVIKWNKQGIDFLVKQIKQ